MRLEVGILLSSSMHDFLHENAICKPQCIILKSQVFHAAYCQLVSRVTQYAIFVVPSPYMIKVFLYRVALYCAGRLRTQNFAAHSKGYIRHAIKTQSKENGAKNET